MTATAKVKALNVPVSVDVYDNELRAHYVALQPGEEVEYMITTARPIRISEVDTTHELTQGEKRVRTNFNPGGGGVVDQIKQETARLIDLCERLKEKDPRLAALAQTAFEEAAMWAVKAATA